MSRFFAFFALALFSVAAWSGVYTSAGSTFRQAASGTHYTGSSGSVSGGVANTIESVNVGGKYVGVPFAGPVVATVAEVAIMGIRSTPGGFVTAAVVGWLAQKGIQYIGDKFMKQGDPVPVDPAISGLTEYCWGDPTTNKCFGSTAESAWDADYNPQGFTRGTKVYDSPGYVVFNAFFNGQPGWQLSIQHIPKCTAPNVWYNGTCGQPPQPCPADYTYHSDGTCWPNNLVPADESDWAKFRGEVPPDDVLNDLCKKLAAMNSSAPGCLVSGVTGNKVTEPLSGWDYDSTTGTWSRQVATVSPSPTANDPERVQITTSTETKPASASDTASGPAETTESTKTPEQNTDFCVLHPDSIACSTLGDPPDVPDLLANQKPVSIAPESGWGPDGGSCPSDLSYTSHGGLVVRFSYEPVCRAATTFRPVVIGLAWISAVLIFLGVSRRANG